MSILIGGNYCGIIPTQQTEGILTADNGLNLSTATNVQLGGNLTETNTEIIFTESGQYLEINGNNLESSSFYIEQLFFFVIENIRNIFIINSSLNISNTPLSLDADSPFTANGGIFVQNINLPSSTLEDISYSTDATPIVQDTIIEINIDGTNYKIAAQSV